MEHAEGQFVTRDGLRLYEQHWRPDGDAAGTVVVVHGFGEHSGRYAEAGERLTAAGFTVYAYDQRGHGRSEGERAYVDTFRDYLVDLDQFLGSVRAREGSTPLFLLGHSMGGAVVALLLVTRQPLIDGVILSGAATVVPSGLRGRLGIGAVSLVSKIAPKSPVRTLSPLDVSRDPAVVEQYENDEAVYHGPMRFGMAAAFARAARRIRDDALLIADPILLLHGEEDALVEHVGSQSLFDAVSSADKTLKVYPGLYHEVLNEPEKDEVFADLIAWLKAHTRADEARPQAAG